MPVLSTILLVTFLLLFYLAVKVTLIQRGVLLFQLTGLGLLFNACLTLVELAILLVADELSILFLSHLTQVFQLLLAYCGVISTLIFCKPVSKSNLKYLKVSMALFALPMIYLARTILAGKFSMIINSVEINHIWFHQIKTEGFHAGLFSFWYFANIIILTSLNFSAYKKETNLRKKNWLLYFSIFQVCNGISLILIFLFYSQDSYVPFLTSIPLAISGIAMSWTFSNFQLFKINPVSAFHNIVENMSNLVIITDTCFSINFINKTALEYLGVEKQKLQNQPIEILKNKVDLQDILKLKERCVHLKKNDFFQEEITLTIQDQINHFQFTFSPIYNQQNQKTGYLFLGNDLTYYKSTTARLVAQTQMLEESNMELERFAYIASHDLKTPLRNVASFLNLIERKMAKYKDQELQDFIHMAQKGANQMYTLIQDVLEYSQLKKIKSKPQEVDLNGVIPKVINNLGEAIYKNNLDLSIDHLPVIKVQETHIIQVFQNLIGNGLKYNENKKPIVQVIYHDLEDLHLFEIKDNGIGIEHKYHDQIFEMFKRLHNSVAYQGSGIGLAICKKIIQDNGGKIWLTSEKGVGSSFFFSWPLSPIKDAKELQLKLVEKE